MVPKFIGFLIGLSCCCIPLQLSGQDSDVEMSPISGSAEQPRRHFRLRAAAELSVEDAARYYDIVKEALSRGYAQSAATSVEEYQTWNLANLAPYPSSTHGKHYVNNYANDIAAAYLKYEDAGTLQPGSVIAKDSFAVTETGGILLGPLAVMEKMPDGFNYASGDWKYTLIQPDGTVLGETNGENAHRVEYCIGCHLAVENQDHLYFIPKEYRRTEPQ